MSHEKTVKPKVNVVLCWHMHQPQYQDQFTRNVHLPWTYLHAIKDYADMAAVVEQVPQSKVVVNFTPVLLDQIDELSRRVRSLYPGSIWSRNRGADHQLALDAMTILLGGHLRVGMEDNLYMGPGRPAGGSVEFVRRVKELCNLFGREIATVEETRKMLQPGHRQEASINL